MSDVCFFINHDTRQIRRADNRAWEKLATELNVAFRKNGWNLKQNIELFIDRLGDVEYVKELLNQKKYSCDCKDWFQ